MRNFYSLGKTCQCGIELANQNKSGFCRSCYMAEFNKEHKEEYSTYNKARYLTEDSALRKQKDAEYYKQNCETRLAKDKIYATLNRERINLRRAKYEKERKKIDLEFRLTKNLRTRLSSAIKDNWKTGSAINDLGCSIEELKKYLESKFKPGMVWENWSQDGWHIDHIKPLASFDLSNADQVKQACHYSNLQPLWAEENLQKSDKCV